MFAWLKHFVRAHALPENPAEPVRVDFVGTIVSPNECTSPITGFTASMVEIVLVDREIVVGRRDTIFDHDDEHARFTPLGGVRLGRELVVADENGRTLRIDAASAPRVVSLSSVPMELDRVPEILRDVAAKSRHMLTYRETRFREDDRVRVVATVHLQEVLAQAGYRDAITRVIAPVPHAPLTLYEML